MPFCGLSSDDFDKVVIGLGFNYEKYENKTSPVSKLKLNFGKGQDKDKPEPKPQCEYFEPSDNNLVVNNICIISIDRKLASSDT